VADRSDSRNSLAVMKRRKISEIVRIVKTGMEI
jgi:hypothetical protein